MTNAWVNVGQRGERLPRAGLVKKHRELVYEVADRVRCAIRSGVGLSGHLLRPDLKLILKVLDLVGFTLKVIMVRMGNDEIKSNECSRRFRMFARPMAAYNGL